MMQVLPVDVQNQVAEHLKEYVIDLQDEKRWDETFAKTQDQLVAAAKRAKQEIAEGKAVELDDNQL